jgi:nucleoside-diphosphate-sugar epimerase
MLTIRSMMTIASFLWILLGLSFITGGHSLANTHIPSQSQTQELLILGLGRVGLEVARQATATATATLAGTPTTCTPHFHSVAGTVRDIPTPSTGTDGTVTGTGAPPTPTSPILTSPAQDGSIVQRIPCQLSAILPRLTDTSHVLVSIPAAAAVPAEEEGSELDAVFDAVVQGLTPGSWLGLLSTTGVYGHYDGAWVTEESECRPEQDSTASRCLEYEAAWCRRATKHGHHLSIFRCAGIYGPSRSALHTVFKKGMLAPSTTPRNSKSDSDSDKPVVMDLTNRIHEQDLAACVVASMLLEKKKDPALAASSCAIYNLADDQPESRSVVMEYASDLLQSIHVPVETRSSSSVAAAAEGTSSRARRRRTDVKRVSNQKMKDVLLPHLQYPTYKEGLEAILNDPASPWQPN